MEGYLKPMEKRSVDRNLLLFWGLKGFLLASLFFPLIMSFFWGWCTYRRMPFFFLGHLGIKLVAVQMVGMISSV